MTTLREIIVNLKHHESGRKAPLPLDTAKKKADNTYIMSDLDAAFADLAPDDESDGYQLPSVPNAFEAPGEMAFDARLAFEVALGYTDVPTLCKKYNISESQWEVIAGSRVFAQAVEIVKNELMEGGSTFKLKAKVLSEAALDTTWLMIQSNRTKDEVKQRLIESLHRVAGHDPRTSSGGDGQNNAFQININLGGG